MQPSFVSETEIDLGARQAFLRAIEKTWFPNPLERLSAAAPKITPWLAIFPEVSPSVTKLGSQFQQMGFNAVPSRIRWAGLLADGSAEAAQARSAIETWRTSWGTAAGEALTASWIMDAALHSIAYARMMDFPSIEWAYSPDAPAWPMIEPPAVFTRDPHEYALQLEQAGRAAKATMKARFDRAPNVDRDAVWLARWLQGESDQKIASSDYRGSEDKVRIARGRFANRAGIRL